MIFFLIRLLKLRVQTQLLQKISGCYAWISSFWYLYLQVLVRCWLWKSPVVSVSRPGVQSLKYTWSYLGSGFKYFFMFTPTLGKWSKLTMIFFKSVETTNWLQVVQLTTVWQHWYWASQVANMLISTATGETTPGFSNVCCSTFVVRNWLHQVLHNIKHVLI